MSLARACAAEAIKAATLPAVWAGVMVALLGSAAVTMLNAVTVRQAVSRGAGGQLSDTSPFETGFAAIPVLVVVGCVIIGVVLIGSEYTAGRTEAGGARQVATTIAALPHRPTLLIAKALVVVVAAGGTALVSIPTNIGLAKAIIGGRGVETVSSEEALTRSLGAGLYCILTALIAMAITTLTRSGTMPLIVLIANSSVVSASLLLTRITPAAHWLPDTAGRELFGFPPEYSIPGGLSAAPGALVMGAWALTLMVVACVVFTRRDA